MSVKGAVFTVRCDGREGQCRNFLEFDLETISVRDSAYSVELFDINSLTEKEGRLTNWIDGTHFCRDHEEDYLESL